MVARAASAAKAAAGDGGTGGSANTVAATVAATAAVSDRQCDEGGTPDGEDEDGGNGDREGGVGSSTVATCLPEGHLLMRQAAVAGNGKAPKPCYDRIPKGDSESFLWVSEDTVGPKGCDLKNGEELILVRFKPFSTLMPSNLAPKRECHPNSSCLLSYRIRDDRLAARSRQVPMQPH